MIGRQARHKPRLWHLRPDAVRFEKVQEDGRRRGERAAAVIDQIEMPGERKAADRDRPQFVGIDLPLDGQPREEGDPQAAFDGILDGRVAAEFERDIQPGERSTGTLQALFQGTSGTRSRLADDERFAGQGLERNAFAGRPAMPRCDDKHKGIAADRAEFKARFLGFLPDQAERRSALFDILR